MAKGRDGYTVAQKRKVMISANAAYLKIYCTKYWKYLDDVNNDFLKGRNDYCHILNDVDIVLSIYKANNVANRD